MLDAASDPDAVFVILIVGIHDPAGTIASVVHGVVAASPLPVLVLHAAGAVSMRSNSDRQRFDATKGSARSEP
jgi:hypothetical protein